MSKLAKSYIHTGKALPILWDIDLTLERGDMVAVVGASGVGKSTFLQILGTLDLPTSGSIKFNGEELTRMSPSRLADFRNREIGFVFQFHHLLPEFTALENVMMPALIQRVPIDKARPQDDLAKGGGKDAAKSAAPGSYASAAIILLTDGQTTTGPDPIESARMAAERGVRVFTVGIGTQGGETIHSEGWTMRVRLDEDALKNIANITRGEYFYAGTAPDLKKIYDALRTRLVMEKRETEITVFFSAAAALLALLSAFLSLLWFNRIL